LSDDLTTIPDVTFSYCSSLQTIDLPDNLTTFTDVTATFYVPSSAISDYESASYWSALTIQAISP